MLRSAFTALAALTLAAHLAGAQERDKERNRDRDVPPGQRPPPGLCRIWLQNVPANQQPAPTDCATAVRNRPEGARIIFPEERSAQRLKLPIPTLTRAADNDRNEPRLVPKPDEKKGKKDKRDKPDKP
jgi:hypothetical protein